MAESSLLCPPCPHLWGRGRGWGLDVTVGSPGNHVFPTRIPDPGLVCDPIGNAKRAVVTGRKKSKTLPEALAKRASAAHEARMQAIAVKGRNALGLVAASRTAAATSCARRATTGSMRWGTTCTGRSLAPVRGLGRHKLLLAAVGRGTGTGVRVHGALDRELVLHVKQVLRLMGPSG